MPCRRKVFLRKLLPALAASALGIGALCASDAVAPAAPAPQTPPATATLVGVPTAERGGAAVPLTLLRADYETDVLGSMALGTLVQKFRNDSREDVLATYSLQGAPGLAIKAVRQQVEGAVGEDASAEDQAPGPGGDATGVAAGQTVDVTVEYEMTLPMENGRFHMVLPAVVRQIEPAVEREEPPKLIEGLVPLDLTGADEEEPEAASVPGAVPMSFKVNIQHDFPLLEVGSKSHEIWVGYYGDRSVAELKDGESLSGRSFDLTFSIGSESEATFVAYAGPVQGGARQVVAVLSPPTKPWAGIIRSKEVLFLLDTSGSMKGKKFDQAREALAVCLEKMDLDDLYNVVEFNHDFSTLSAKPVEVSEVPPDEARDWLQSLEADGGTKLLPGLSATLKQAEAKDHHRMIVILTDGALADEEKVLDVLDKQLGEGRLFVIGIGQGVRRDAIKRIAEHGRGTAAFADDLKSLEPVVASLFDSVAAPLVWDLEFDFGGAAVEAIEPSVLPDLYAGRPVTAIARVSGGLPEEILLRGFTADGERSWAAQVRSFDAKRLEEHSRSAKSAKQMKARPAGRR